MPTGLTLASDKLVPNAVAITEWYSKIDGTIEACGQASAAMALHSLKGTPATASFVTALAQETVSGGQVTDAPHASTSPANLKWLLGKHGVTATIHTGDWETALRAFAGVKPLLIGVAHAEAFGGHDAHVDGHWVCVFGYSASGGYAVGDPNTPEATSGALVTYTLAQFQAARPFAALVPQENPLASIPVVGGVLDAAVSPVNQAIHHINGFSDLVAVIDADEHIVAPGVSSLLDLPGWVFGNMKAWLIRGVFIGVGLLLILAVLIQVIKQADPDFWQSLSPAQAGQTGPQGGFAPAGGAAGDAADAGAAGAGGGIPVEAMAL